jgi:hypothetical protein
MAFGAVFGAIIGIVLTLCGVLPKVNLAALFPAIAVGAYFASYVLAALLEMALKVALPGNSNMGQSLDVSPVSIFAGGTPGGFLLFSFTSILLQSVLVDANGGFRESWLKALAWSPVAGILGIIGWALGPTLGIAIWSAFDSLGLTPPAETVRNALGQTSDQFSLFLVWQAGVGFVLAIILRRLIVMWELPNSQLAVIPFLMEGLGRGQVALAGAGLGRVRIGH